ncbi:MAG: hypothetical protein ACYTBJ_27425 [Planctomycetota bacterium]
MGYGLDYAMYRHDIERLESVGIQDANEKIALGWKPLHMTSHEWGTDVIMGVPRPKECEKHLDKIKVYYLRDDG